MSAGTPVKVLRHFRARSRRYNKSSRWVGDPRLLDRIFRLAGIRGDETVLDLATGTGLVARRFKGRAREVIGLDVSPPMARQGARHVDRMIIAPIEAIPLESGSVDVCVCRQGLQFVRLPQAVKEIVRVLRPGGRAVFCHLNAYGSLDKREAFRIQALRNPSRVNYFVPGDLESALEKAGLRVTKAVRYLSNESVRRWIDHGAGRAEERNAILMAYRKSSPAFRKLHRLRMTRGDIFDTMLFMLIRAEKPV